MAANGIAPHESGAALIVFLTLLVLAGSAMFVDASRSALMARAQQSMATSRSLAEAKAALIAWAVTAYSARGKPITPGLLPFPDRNRDGNYDGKGDCVTFGLNDSHLLGRLPWAGDASPCPRIGLHIDAHDGAGERLWYAVSRNLVTRGGGAPINSDMRDAANGRYAWITLRDVEGDVIADPATGQALPIAAVIIAPGAALAGQDRSAAAPPPASYLDSIRIGTSTYTNADADGCPDASVPACGASGAGEDFIMYPPLRAPGVFNDQLVAITVDELMRAVEKRVLGEAAIALNAYRRDYGAYPWLARLHSPRVVAAGIAARAPRSSTRVGPSFKSTLSRAGLLPVHLRDEVFSTGFGGAWRFVDATPTTATAHSGNAKLIPPLVDLVAGSIDVAGDKGRCLWSDWTRVDCAGSSVDAAHLRPDLGVMVSRTVAYAFSFVDESPLVTPPAPADVRRRTLSIAGAALGVADFPRLSEDGWSIRVTDDDGVNQGQRDFIIDADTAGAIRVTDIRYDLSVVYDEIDDARDELPEWFAKNEWHHLLYVALSTDAVAGGDVDGDGDCRTPSNACLMLNVEGRRARTDVRALLISAGAERGPQNRASGDCDGDGVVDDFLCTYLEGDNADRSAIAGRENYARNKYSADFNDQLRVVAPLPP